MRRSSIEALFQPGFDLGPFTIDDAKERDIPRTLVRRGHILAQGAFARGADPQQCLARWLILGVGLELHPLCDAETVQLELRSSQ